MSISTPGPNAGAWDLFFCGPRHWATFWRRAWLVTLPLSLVVWPGVFFPVLPVSLIAVLIWAVFEWVVDIWKEEK